ncbi:TspO/MBR family protein [Haloarcula pellucida]|uniref:Sensory protein TspO n=1 Tax=Haloarcula pellucida TaxID=1427151 RepID=A0A830GKG8_9EURY|nr:TspO/MBR family protein [Halomicroarcula pellucida]MBX0347739.1 tryptophan-rich sensory protein [Halomicroarcula pellucida]GGN90079.1 sensory protein TspO [Halomicroarcula pellucida]
MLTTQTARLSRGDLPGVLATILLVNVVGAAPAALGGPDSAWFQRLVKPGLYPPPWVFGVVWTTLFTLMGVALYLVWRADAGRQRRLALGLFAAQMAFNVAWTPTFFQAQNLTLALGVILGLLALLLPTTVAFYRVRRRAGLLLVPYLLWVAFAAVLNYRFVAVN